MVNMKTFFAVICSLLLHVLCFASAAEVIPLPGLSDPALWRSSNPALLSPSGDGKFLVIELGLTKETAPQQLMLKNPIVLRPGFEIMFDATLTEVYPTILSVIAEDSKGNPYRYVTSSYGSIKRGNFLGGRFRGGLDPLGETRVRVKGMLDPVRESWQAMGKVRSAPVPPLKFLGFEFRPESSKSRGAKFYLRNFRLSNANHKNEPFYYQFKEEEFYGTADGDPKIYITDLGGSWGDTYIVDWELRDTYDGQPFLTGSKSVKIHSSDTSIPHRVKFCNDPVIFRVRNEGTYFLRCKLRSNFRNGKPTLVRELEFRYAVLKGEPSGKHPRIAPEARIGRSLIRMAYDRDSFIWKENEKWNLKFRIFDAPGCKTKLTLRRLSGQSVFSREFDVKDSVQSFDADLSTLSPGAYNAEIAVFDNGIAIDRIVRTIGKKCSPENGKLVRPKDIPSAKQIRDGKEPLVLFAPMIHDKQRLVHYYIRLMDEMVKAKNSREFEIQTSWPEMEPMPDIYDFSIIDEILNEARKRGLRAFVTFAPLKPPAWMPACYTQNADGRIFGHNAYLFHGGRLNLFQSPYLRERALRFLRALTLHVRSHPALLGYFYISEHSGEAPWADWYEGFDSFTKNNFRRHAEKLYQTIEQANAVWMTNFVSFQSIEPPVVGKPASNTFRRDWLMFRRGAIHDFIVECVKTIREADDYRIIMLYLDGVILNRLADIARYDVISANGGCAVPERGYQMTIVADANVPQRAEEITCSIWEGSDFPTRLDVSFFTMMMGGGANSHCKMFIGQGVSFDKIRKPPQGLERFEKFIPLWKELRSARIAFREVCGYSDYEGTLTAGQTVNFSGMNFGAWNNKVMMDSQIPFFSNVTNAWKKTKMTVASPLMKLMAQKDCDALYRYVKNGGTLFMTADTGRRVIEKNGEDWVLLRSFGFREPEVLPKEWYAEMDIEPGSRWSKFGGSFCTRVRSPFVAPKNCGEVLMRMTNVRKSPALTMKRVGKGKVYVLWLGEIIPWGFDKPESGSFLRLIAKDADLKLPVEADNRLIMTNLLKNENVRYLLVMRDKRGTKGVLKSKVRLPYLPKGNYRIRELISESPVQIASAERLAEKGLEIPLKPMEVSIYKIDRIDSGARMQRE